jgi:hypothetical protein
VTYIDPLGFSDPTPSYGTWQSLYAGPSPYTVPLIVRMGGRLVGLREPIEAMQLVSRPKRGTGLAAHEAILYVRGGILRLFDRQSDRIRDLPFEEVADEAGWQALADVPTEQLAAAEQRMEAVRDNPGAYDAIDRNCQHTARLIAFGKAESPAVTGWTIVLLTALACAAHRGRSG